MSRPLCALAFGMWVLGFVGVPPATAQEWIEYRDTTDRFLVNFPSQPAIRDIMYKPQRGKIVPGRVYTVQSGPARYSITVVNLAGLDGTAIAGAVAWEAWNVRKRGGEITYDAYAQVDRIAGHQLQITNRDKTRTTVAIHELNKRLYILEATGPPNTGGLVLFQMSLVILDENGKRIRYQVDDEGNRTGRVPESQLCYLLTNPPATPKLLFSAQMYSMIS